MSAKVLEGEIINVVPEQENIMVLLLGHHFLIVLKTVRVMTKNMKIIDKMKCHRCGNTLVLEKGPKYLPNYEYRCKSCQIGTHGEYGLLWTEADAREAWMTYRPDLDQTPPLPVNP
jgi:hypothetical protein